MRKTPRSAVGRLIGYARVSTEEQNLDMQLRALHDAGVHPDDLHVEKVSASSKRRPAFQWMLENGLREGDTVVVWRLDRLMRSLVDLLEIMQRLKDMGVGFRSLTEQIDLSTPNGQLVFHIIGALAQWERDVIRQRTRAGVVAAKARGVKFGAQPKLTDAMCLTMRDWRKEKPKPTYHEVAERVFHKWKIKIAYTTARNACLRKIKR